MRIQSRDIVLLFGLVFIAFGCSLAGNVFTDDLSLIRNARLSSWSLNDLCTSFRLEHQDYSDGWLPVPFNDFSLRYFRPMIMASIKLDYALWKTWTPGFHLTNIVIFCAMLSLLLIWARDFGLDRKDQLLLGVLFVLYSPNQMTVNLIASRTELIADVFMLASVICLGRFYYRRTPLLFAGALCTAVLALGSKENAVILPVLHACTAFLVYPPRNTGKNDNITLRVLSLVPFFLMIPGYFYVRAHFLGGFPEPLKGFYFHHPLDPGFVPFLISKIIHAVLTLVYQFPVLLPPVLIEYSLPTAVITGLISAATLVAMWRITTPPFRYFMILWIGACIAPTLPMGLNPIYYFLCSTVMVIFYVQVYRKYSASPVPWHARTARILLVSSIIFGLLNGIGGGINLRMLGEPSRTIAEGTRAVLDARPEIKSVYFLDAPLPGYDIVPTIRYQDEAHASKKFYLLSLRANLFDQSSCEITQVDACSFDIRPTEGSLLRTGLEETFVAYPIPTFRPGMKAFHPEYEMEVVEGGPEIGLDGAGLVARLKNHYRMPPASQNGISVLRFRFKTPLAAADRLFLQMTESGLREVKFLTESELSEKGANRMVIRNPL